MAGPKAILINDTRVDNHHGCSTVYETITRLADRSGIEIIATAPAHRNWQQDEEVMAAVDAADLLIVNGEGTIHHDRPAGKWLLAAGEFARTRGKKSALINATWQDNGTEYASLARAFDVITVRESASEAELRELGIACRRIPDLALYHQPEAPGPRKGVLYTDNVVGPSALQLYRRMWKLGGEPIALTHGRRDLVSTLRDLRRFAERKEELLVPSTGLAALRAAAIDWQVQDADREAFSRRVASAELIVTGRFHMLIYALAARTPFLVVDSNTHKNAATVADSGTGLWRHVPVESIDSALIERARRWNDGEAERLDRFVKKGRADMESLFDDLRGLC